VYTGGEREVQTAVNAREALLEGPTEAATARPPERVGVVTDSLSWIPPDLARELGIRIVPLHVFFGDEQYTETVDITPQEFYRRLKESKVLPRTSQPSPGEFLDVYRDVAKRADAILSVHASSRLSGTFHSAQTAAGLLRQERPDVRIECLDTLQIAMAEGIVAVRAAEAAATGVPFDRIVADARALLPKPQVLVVVETLEYLYRGGRIGRARALLGGLLRIRPILTVTDGEVAPKDRARTRSQAMARVVDLMAEYAQGRPFGHVGVFHAEAPDVAEELTAMVRSRFTVNRFVASELGPVIGTHVGPGAFGTTYHCD
jgi:DegV family protein with EDD domain